MDIQFTMQIFYAFLSKNLVKKKKKIRKLHTNALIEWQYNETLTV